MNLHLKDKNFLITGSSRGIGKAIAEGFLKERANVGLVARTSATLKQTVESLTLKHESNLDYWKADLRDVHEVEHLAIKVSQQWKSLNGLVVNVGSGKSLPDPITDSKQWDFVWDTNFKTALNTVRCFLPFIEKSKGSIIFISSICGVESLGAPTDYSVAKSALISLSKNLARKVGPNTRVNTVAPGNIYFEGGTWDEKIKSSKAKVHEMLKTEVPLQRFGSPNEITDAVVFLSSERASFVTGATLVVDGGQTRSF